jgi:hypothetical protein
VDLLICLACGAAVTLALKAVDAMRRARGQDLERGPSGIGSR